MKALNKKILRDIGHRKFRTILTVLGIAVGIFCLSAIGVASGEFQSSFAYSLNQASQQDMQIYTSPTSPNLANVLASQPNVKAVQSQGYIVTNWTIGDSSKQMKVVGVLDFQHVLMNKFQLIEGRLPGPNQILLSASDRALEPIQVGDQIKIQEGNSYRTLTISGFVVTQGLPSPGLTNQGQGYMAESDFEKAFQRPGVTDFLIQLKDYGQLNQSAQQLASIVEAQHVAIAGLNIGRDTSVSDLLNGVFALMKVLSLVAILLSSLLLLGTVSALIREQVQYIGTMKAIGASRGKMMRHYLSLVVLYSVIGTAIGLASGIAGGYALASYLGNLVSINIQGLQVTPILLIECVLVGLGIPMLAVVLPVYLGTRLTVKQAMSGYGLENTAGGMGIGSRFVRLLSGGFPQTIQFGARSIFRKPTRAVLTLIILVASGSSFLAVTTASYAFNTFISQVVETYHYNVLVSFSDPQSLSTFQHSLGSVEGIRSIEALEQDQVSTQWGNALLSGLPIDTKLYQHPMLAGRWFTDSDTNVVIISQDTANKSGLKVGDTISFNTPIQSVHWQVIGMLKDYSGIGPGNLGTLVAPLNQVTDFMHETRGTASGFMVQSSDTSQTAVDALSDKINNQLTSQGLMPDVVTAQQQVQGQQSKYQIIYTLLEAVSIIIALVGVISLSNTMAMSILERRREIGILRSLGAVGRKVALVFWTEGLVQGVLSWLVALVVGIPLAYGLILVQATFLAPVPFAFNPAYLLWMLALILVVVSLACVGPVMGASRMKVARTLHYE